MATPAVAMRKSLGRQSFTGNRRIANTRPNPMITQNGSVTRSQVNRS